MLFASFVSRKVTMHQKLIFSTVQECFHLLALEKYINCFLSAIWNSTLFTVIVFYSNFLNISISNMFVYSCPHENYLYYFVCLIFLNYVLLDHIRFLYNVRKLFLIYEFRPYTLTVIEKHPIFIN